MPTLGDWISLFTICALVYAIYQGIRHGDNATAKLNEKFRELEVRARKVWLTRSHMASSYPQTVFQSVRIAEPWI